MNYKFRAYGRDMLSPKLKEFYNELLYNRLITPSIFFEHISEPLPWWKRYLNKINHFGYRLRRAWLVLTDREECEE